jgi:hypothetical protein
MDEINVPQEVVLKLLTRIGEIVKEKAIKFAPIDYGMLRTRIDFKVDMTIQEVKISCTDPNAEKLEYGTPGEPLSEQEKDQLADWAERHDLPAFPVIRKIEREGIKVGTAEKPLMVPNGTFRPFMRPALFQSTDEIKMMVKTEMETLK